MALRTALTARDQEAVKPPWSAVLVTLADLDLQEQQAGIGLQVEGQEAVFGGSGFPHGGCSGSKYEGRSGLQAK
ncbi:hypothetical protein C6366_14315 [Desulfonatronum sp. SC1]|nr:hypothetical protein C6366_14315 [Desulfonatronum sp. SC1]